MSTQRNTVQRQIILGALLQLKTHPTIDEVYAMIHREHPSISISTIYRNLRRLAKDGVIRRVSLPDGLERYDQRTDQHYHFKCKNCGSIFDVEISDPENLAGINEEVARRYGFSVNEHDIAFSGLCSKCKINREGAK